MQYSLVKARKDNIVAGLVKYFHRHPQIFVQVLQKHQKGKFLEELRKETLKAVTKTVTPAVALAIKVLYDLLIKLLKYALKLSNKKYLKLKRIIKGSFDFLSNSFMKYIGYYCD